MQKALLLICLIASQQLFANPIQEAIDASKEHSIIEIPKGIYKGKIVINKPIKLKAVEDGVVIEGDNSGSVITINSPYVSIDGFTIINSGRNKKNNDSAILANNVSQLKIVNNKIENSYIGVGFYGVSDSLIDNNKINGDKEDVVLRADAIAVYGGQNNTISNNKIFKKRDLIVDGSYNNKVLNNDLDDMRYAIHGMNATGNIFEGNSINDSIAGLYYMYNEDYTVKNNVVRNSKGTKGIGLGLIECTGFHISNNKFLYNTVGMVVDASPEEMEGQNVIKENEFLYNSEGVRFKEILINSAMVMGKNYFLSNIFSENISDVIDESSNKELSTEAVWEGNYWDKYKGLDEDGDGIGDIPYSLYFFADVVWMKKADAKFFFASIGMSVKDFLGRIMPTRDPYLVLTDLKPKINKGDVK